MFSLSAAVARGSRPPSHWSVSIPSSCSILTVVAHTYPSLRLHGVSESDYKAPADNLNHSRAEVEPYDTYIPIAAEVTKLAQVDGGFEATDSTGKLHLGKKVILANGVENKFPDIPGCAEAWSKGM